MGFPPFPPSAGALEEELLDRWRAESLFEKTLGATAEGAPFVFWECTIC
jgi:hypothetical protein